MAWEKYCIGNVSDNFLYYSHRDNNDALKSVTGGNMTQFRSDHLFCHNIVWTGHAMFQPWRVPLISASLRLFLEQRSCFWKLTNSYFFLFFQNEFVGHMSILGPLISMFFDLLVTSPLLQLKKVAIVTRRSDPVIFVNEKIKARCIRLYQQAVPMVTSVK